MFPQTVEKTPAYGALPYTLGMFPSAASDLETGGKAYRIYFSTKAGRILLAFSIKRLALMSSENTLSILFFSF